MARRSESIKNLIDVEVFGDILLHDPKFLDDDNVITKAFLNTSLAEFTNDLEERLPDELRHMIGNDEQTIELIRRALLVFVTTNPELRESLKDYLIELISRDIDTQNHIKERMSWLIIE